MVDADITIYTGWFSYLETALYLENNVHMYVYACRWENNLVFFFYLDHAFNVNSRSTLFENENVGNKSVPLIKPIL